MPEHNAFFIRAHGTECLQKLQHVVTICAGYRLPVCNLVSILHKVWRQKYLHAGFRQEVNRDTD